ncbi:hypothetical protein ZYGR_0I06000 [Zygosaccharomyces rouxii]|uniref:ZYRO0C14256p n=2 Tax=Zygosaccharomyces rouxii TaxID=4956 RepID=C5DU65_ZYGRC|nr:uncharacterized protein ZYRO0C14256g [Zygosaccharomyces rouxii]KAH9201498.1 Brix domain-containing protein [Zygosaccharomyces rouxii]GAV48303.1 hypothetical protein ZYGR_0I06000 [Zygosaccharomyces rouxii]CAR27326.1 ZYRO0C14256p [Zygosaccharomyces rouxii]
MAKRRTKKRTHATVNPEEITKIPKSMVIRVGQTSMGNHSLNQLVKDFRHVMEPYTALKLKERKSNKLKDFVVMCGPLSVSHLFIFTQSERTGNVSLKVARAPHGPTITFQVEDFSLSKDIKRFLRRPKSLNDEDTLNPPLLVLNGFNSLKNKQESPSEEANVEKVIVSLFQNVFPPLNPSKTQLNTIKRVFMVNKDPETGEISLRHYYIDIHEVDISKNLKHLYTAKNNLHKSVPNLHKKEDISSLVFDHDVGAYTSESEVEDEAVVSMLDKQNVKVGSDQQPQQKPQQEEEQPTRKKAVKLTEIGPRINMKLVKIEEGICSGKVLHHEFVQKTDTEIKALIKRHEQKKKLKEQRRKEQEENVSRKQAVKDAKKKRKMERRERKSGQSTKENDDEEVASSSGSEASDGSDDGSANVSEESEKELFSGQE